MKFLLFFFTSRADLTIKVSNKDDSANQLLVFFPEEPKPGGKLLERFLSDFSQKIFNLIIF